MPVNISRLSLPAHRVIQRNRTPTPPVSTPEPAFDATAVHVVGMHGMGDNLHQRAAVRQLMAKQTVLLETPWPCIYHDLQGPTLRLVKKPTALRTQAKNSERESKKYDAVQIPKNLRVVRVWYSGEDVKKHGSVFAAMMRNAGCDPATGDFRLPIPTAWYHELAKHIDLRRITKPILLYRPLVERTEWGGCTNRNPDFDAYSQLLATIRDRFFLISVADLVPSVEWQMGELVHADIRLHNGELCFEALAALIQQASLVYCSPGFAAILAQAVGTPSVCVFGGYENATSFSAGAKFAPYLGIDPIEPCSCFSHKHNCKKRIDLPRAKARLLTFVGDNLRGDDSAAVHRKDARQLELTL